MPSIRRSACVALSALALVSVTESASAQLLADGFTLSFNAPGSLQLSSTFDGTQTTVGELSEACVYLDANGNTIGTGFIERGGEIVYTIESFGGGAPFTIAIEQTSSAPGTDIDYFLVTSLDTVPVADAGDGMGGCDAATGGVSIAIDSSGIFEGFLLQPGEIVYLVCDTFTNPGQFDALLTYAENTTPDLTPNTGTELGTLPIGAFRITGANAGVTNRVTRYYTDTGALLGFNSPSREIVYTFQVPEEGRLALNSNDGIFQGVDHDHYLLDGLTRTPTFNDFPDTGVCVNTIGFVDEAGEFDALLQPGVDYYLSVDAFDAAGGAYDITLLFTPSDAITEDETDCLSVNAGCPGSPAQFSPIAVGELGAGTLAIDTMTAETDEDWWLFTVSEQAIYQAAAASVTSNASPLIELITLPGGPGDCALAEEFGEFAINPDFVATGSGLFNLAPGDYAVKLSYPTGTVTTDIPCVPGIGSYLFQVFTPFESNQLTTDTTLSNVSANDPTTLTLPIAEFLPGGAQEFSEACTYANADDPGFTSPNGFDGTTGGEYVVEIQVQTPGHLMVDDLTGGTADFDYFLLRGPNTASGLTNFFPQGDQVCDIALETIGYAEDGGFIASEPLLPGQTYYLVADLDLFTTPSPTGSMSFIVTLTQEAFDADCDADIDADDAQAVCDILSGATTPCDTGAGDVDFDGDTDADDAAFYCDVLRALPGGLVEGQVPGCIDCGVPDVIYVDADWTPFRGPPTFGPFSSERNIQSAIDRIADGGTILVYPGTYDFFGNVQTLDLGTKNLTIEGLGATPDEVNVALRIPGTGPMDQAFRIAGGQDETTRIANVRFQAQSPSLFPSVFVSNAAPRFESCVFAGGGGLAGLGGAVTVSDSTPSAFTVTVFEDCVFVDSIATALNVNSAQVRLNRCRMETQSPGSPRFLFVQNGASAGLANCTITAELLGPSTVIESSGGSSLSLVNCTVAGVTNIANNSTPLFQLAPNGSFFLDNTIIANNRDGDGDVIPAFSASGSIGFAFAARVLTDDPSVDALFSTALGDPLFVDSAGGDFRLSPGSPAIDAGDNASYEVPLFGATDIGGVDRFLDDTGTPDTGNGTAPIIDIGAHEFDGTSPVNLCMADFDNNGQVDLTDFGAFGMEFGRGLPGGGPPCTAMDPCLADFDANGQVDLTDFGTFGMEFGRGLPGGGPSCLP